MRLDINLATHPYEDPRNFWMRWGTALAGLIILSLALVFYACIGWFHASQDRALIRQRQTQIIEEQNQNNPTSADSVQFDISAFYVPDTEFSGKGGSH